MEFVQRCLRNKVAYKFYLHMPNHSCQRLQWSNNLPRQVCSNSSHLLRDHSQFRFYLHRPRRSCRQLSGRLPPFNLKQMINKFSLLHQNGHHSNYQEASNRSVHKIMKPNPLWRCISFLAYNFIIPILSNIVKYISFFVIKLNYFKYISIFLRTDLFSWTQYNKCGLSFVDFQLFH